MTKPLYLVLLTVLSLHATPLFASDAIGPYVESGKSGHFLYAVYNNNWLMKSDNATRLAITGLTADAKGDLLIPASIKGIEVYGIDDNAFKTSTGIRSIRIPGSVRFLRPGTLNQCKGLEAIVVDEDHPQFASVDGLMYDKLKTKLLAVGSGHSGHFQVSGFTTTIGQLAFAHCSELTRITLPPSVSDIGGFRGTVFLDCSKLARIDIPDTVTHIGQKSFEGCSSLQQVTVPPKVPTIPFGLFWKCSSLRQVTLPDGISSIGNYAFAGCRMLTLAGLPKSLTEVGAYAFKDCKGLSGLKVAPTVTTIQRGAFNGAGVHLPPHQ
jgi:hypothetical protein